MKKMQLLLFTLSCGLFNVAYADLASDADIIFNWAEKTFPQYFSNKAVTQTLDVWLYRYYPTTNIYVGVNRNDVSVNIMGGEFGSVPKKAGLVKDFLAAANPPGQSGECVTISDRATKDRKVTTESYSLKNGKYSNSPTSIRETLYKYKPTSGTESKYESEIEVTETSGGKRSHSTIIGKGYIENGVSYATFSQTTTSDGSVITTTFEPGYLGLPYRVFCLNQTFSRESVTYSVTYSPPLPSITDPIIGKTQAVNIKIEAIEDIVTTPAGTFRTVRITNTSQQYNTVDTQWISIDDGINIKNITPTSEEFVTKIQ